MKPRNELNNFELQKTSHYKISYLFTMISSEISFKTKFKLNEFGKS